MGSYLRSFTPLKTIIRKFASDREVFERSLNQVQLIGRTGNDPQKRGSDANPVIVFSLATSSNYKANDGSSSQKVEWHRICVFKPVLRDVVFNFLKKGQRIYICGRLTYGEITDETGRRTILTSVIADDIIFFGNSGNASSRTSSNTSDDSAENP